MIAVFHIDGNGLAVFGWNLKAVFVLRRECSLFDTDGIFSNLFPRCNDMPPLCECFIFNTSVGIVDDTNVTCGDTLNAHDTANHTGGYHNASCNSAYCSFTHRPYPPLYPL